MKENNMKFKRINKQKCYRTRAENAVNITLENDIWTKNMVKMRNII